MLLYRSVLFYRAHPCVRSQTNHFVISAFAPIPDQKLVRPIVAARPQRDTRTMIDYNEKDRAAVEDEHKYVKLLHTKRFAKNKFLYVDGHSVTLEWLRAFGFKEPFLVESADGLEMRMPPASLTVDQVADACGRDKTIDAMEVLTQADKQMTLDDWAKYFTESIEKRKRLLNVISLEVGSTKLAQLIERPRIVRELDWTEIVWPPRDSKPEFPRVQLYCLMNFGGSSVFYHILSGEKIFYFIRPTPINLRKYEKWSNSPDQSKIFLGDEVKECIEIHAVFTPKDTIVIGGNFLHGMNISGQLEIYDVENKINVPLKFRFPYFLPMQFYAAKYYLAVLKPPKLIPFAEKQEALLLLSPAQQHLLSKYELSGLLALSQFLARQITALNDTSKPNAKTRAFIKASVPAEITNVRRLVKKFGEAVRARCRESGIEVRPARSPTTAHTSKIMADVVAANSWKKNGMLDDAEEGGGSNFAGASDANRMELKPIKLTFGKRKYTIIDDDDNDDDNHQVAQVDDELEYNDDLQSAEEASDWNSGDSEAENENDDFKTILDENEFEDEEFSSRRNRNRIKNDGAHLVSAKILPSMMQQKQAYPTIRTPVVSISSDGDKRLPSPEFRESKLAGTGQTPIHKPRLQVPLENVKKLFTAIKTAAPSAKKPPDSIFARQIYDSRGNPTVKVEVTTTNDGQEHNNGVNIAPHQNPLVQISNAADLITLPNGLKPSGLVIGDGSCLSRTGSQDGYQQLHQSVVQLLRSSRLQFEPEIYRIYNCSMDDYCTRMARNCEFGDIIFIMASALVLEVEIQVFTFSSNQNGASTLLFQTFTPTHPHTSTIQIHLDSGQSEQEWTVDAETGLRRVTNVLVREPHFDTLVSDDRRDSGDNMMRKLPSADNNQSDLLIQFDRHEPFPCPPPPPPPHAPVPPPPILYTLLAKVKGRVYVPRGPYQLFETAKSSDEACLERPPVFGLDGRATHLYFEIASWEVMWDGLNKKTREKDRAAILLMIEKTGKTLEQIENMGPSFCGITLLQGDNWYSLACLYRKKINIAMAGKDAGRGSGISSRCRGCLANHNTLNQRLRMTFEVEEALNYKASMLIHNGEWSSKVKKDVSYSLVLKVLRNGGFIHLRTQADINAIRKPLTKVEQVDHLTWIKVRTHRGFRTGAELILLTEAGLNMVSFDRSDSSKKIDELGQTIVADSRGFNRLSNSLSERRTDELLLEILAGEYAEGDAAFERRNGRSEPGRLSDAWEEAIKVKFKDMSVERRTAYIVLYNPTSRRTVPDIRIWTLTDFQRCCRRNANSDGNLVDQISVDRVINNSVAGLSGILKSRSKVSVNDYDELEAIMTFHMTNSFGNNPQLMERTNWLAELHERKELWHKRDMYNW
ncbi:JmjC domain-containing histone demethylation protein 1 [Physocladia obscura]|uniref:[histone H3]-dimethyl-L-lysine(36) demethylase n=1 Tax=Physocladia obscura TaxID=109957 RepID=A0AAD5T816_9FUNG|nr:JmjC domain-containing histone demethylation protein 1 [Physocladia obscura]